MKIYTKTGDKGETGYIGGRISKASALINLVGSLDELNTCLGICTTQCSVLRPTKIKPITRKLANYSTSQLPKYLTIQQGLILHIGAAASNLAKPTKQDFWPAEIKRLEKSIDQMEHQLPVLQNFILPGGSELAAHLHHSRSICRSVEREIVGFLENVENNDTVYLANLQQAQKWLNRLSDWLFVAARYTNQALGVEDAVWRSGNK